MTTLVQIVTWIVTLLPFYAGIVIALVCGINLVAHWREPRNDGVKRIGDSLRMRN